MTIESLIDRCRGEVASRRTWQSVAKILAICNVVAACIWLLMLARTGRGLPIWAEVVILFANLAVVWIARECRVNVVGYMLEAVSLGTYRSTLNSGASSEAAKALKRLLASNDSAVALDQHHI